MNEPIEDLERVAAFESALEKHRNQLLDPLEDLARLYPEATEKRLGCFAWPLRPLFLDGQRLHSVARKIYAMLQKARERLRVDTSQLRFPPEVLDRLELQRDLDSPHFLQLARPDGFYLADRFVVGELNVGSGLLATLCYTEILHHWLSRNPAWQELGWDPRLLSRPLPHYLKSLGLEPGARVALLTPSAEVKCIYEWEKTMYCQVLAAHGIEGRLLEPPVLENFDLVLQVTAGEAALADPSTLSDCPVHPASCLMLEKGLLPWLQTQELTPSGEVAFPECFFPDSARAEQLRLEKDRWVLKRAWAGKDTVIGRASHGRAWNRAVTEAADSSRFIAQEYYSLPVVEMPYLIDGEIQRVTVRFEVSPFLVDGEYAGALVRYAPDREGVLLSPSPEDVGMTLVYS